MGCHHWLGGLLMFLFTQQAVGQVVNPVEKRVPDQEWTGRVKVVGSQLSRYVVLDVADGQNQRLCENPVSDKIAKLVGMTLQVNGQIYQPPGRARACAEAVRYQIVKTTTGRKAAVGTLRSGDEKFYVETQDGKIRIQSLLPGMQDLVGQKVIISVQEAAGLAEGAVQATSYMAYPE